MNIYKEERIIKEAVPPTTIEIPGSPAVTEKEYVLRLSEQEAKALQDVAGMDTMVSGIIKDNRCSWRSNPQDIYPTLRSICLGLRRAGIKDPWGD